MAPVRPRPKCCWPARLVRALVLAACVGGVALQGQSSREYDLKAVFLFHFSTFVEWPPAAEPEGPDRTPFTIGVLGDDPFGPALQDVVRGERVRGAPFVVQRVRSLAEARRCQILFVSDSETPRLARIFEELRGRPVLTVGDSPRFVEAGGMIGFSTGAHLQLHVGPEAIRAAGLVVSSKLLRVAKIHGGTLP